MKQKPQTLSVNILDKEYNISCPEDEVDALLESAAYLDRKMREIKKHSNLYGLERIAIMAALNIANDYLSESHHANSHSDDQTVSLEHLANKVDHAIKRLRAMTH
ncbi:MAG: cell division protein ZapA [Gammaproteobacteria bacterium]|nr:cell division protein ZapA [Gammaproteobacteria bacterium]